MILFFALVALIGGLDEKRGDAAKLALCLALCNQFNAIIEANRKT